MSEYATITAEQLKARLDAGEKLRLIDVREDEEVAQGMIPGAIHIPLGQVPQRLDEIPRDEEVIFVCRSGYRSGQACGYLASLGFKQPVNLEGGMLAWQQL
ncbi:MULTISPECIES: rhodanese-like domain-containing protein [Cohnella]|jgi:rhodanese-related sulfurtransferase|uniref:rhodanese-like domain-containing protein n=1 Tax=Cohnella TaxID=329857 RepID=UPI00036B7E4E|nr:MULTISPECIES: rhodanese-like domain-containing protein [Cohnella]REK67095.1 MAG: rhodanese-like domain-containing protein [Cohnella sp.]